MAEYIERGKAISMRFEDGIDEDGVIYVPWRDVVAHLKSLPAADVVEVVRCQECKHWNGIACVGYIAACMNADDFCSCGERRASNG